MAQIRSAVDFPGGNWISSLVLCLTGWSNLALGCADRARRGDFTYCTGMSVRFAHLATGNDSSPGLPGSPILVSLHFISDARVVSFLYSAVSVPPLFLPLCFLRERALH
jgi:hypothetical protein